MCSKEIKQHLQIHKQNEPTGARQTPFYIAGVLIKKLQNPLSVSAWRWCHWPHMSTSANDARSREGPCASPRPPQVQFSEQDWTALNNGWKLKRSYKETAIMMLFSSENVRQRRGDITARYSSIVPWLKNGEWLSFFPSNILKNTCPSCCHSFCHFDTSDRRWSWIQPMSQKTFVPTTTSKKGHTTKVISFYHVCYFPPLSLFLTSKSTASSTEPHPQPAQRASHSQFL